MKKLFLSVYFLSIVVFYGYSQSLTLSNHNGPITPNSTIVQAGTPDSVELVTYFNVKNVGANTIRVLCKKVQISLLDSTEVTMCWAGGCYGSGTNVSPNDQPIAPGETITEFSGHYAQVAFSHFKSGESIVRWVFFDRANVNDSVSVTVKYTTYPLGIAESIAQQATLSNFYPNPAISDASCSYSVPAGIQGTIVVRDILGAAVQTHILSSASGKVTINTANLNDGIYFCSLLVNGKNIQSRKLIVRH
jgi:hypothetical protein